ncbi:hypothetical protein NLJ89_g934 [Agrocybe chaxingu]|uniref:Uncharacterized protein n=1 Tax=Agrocybe chaxingu TaxID=84603 RepID=A0A9W8N141_9AGAR|nr:hypothetical protein NLJ89_g934 [Agrocybe chaxingu]
MATVQPAEISGTVEESHARTDPPRSSDDKNPPTTDIGNPSSHSEGEDSSEQESSDDPDMPAWTGGRWRAQIKSKVVGNKEPKKDPKVKEPKTSDPKKTANDPKKSSSSSGK